MGEQEFIQQCNNRFDELITRQWPPFHEIPDHAHPFELRALVTQGLMWLTVDGIERALEPGDVFSLPREKIHSERYGPRGATYLVARKTHNPPEVP